MPDGSTFEIKIAVLGNVSTGKTTLLNALFGDQYGEVSTKRTNAGINFFRVHASVDIKSETTMESGVETGTTGSPKMRSTESLSKEISDDNSMVGTDGDEQIFETTINIELKKDLMPMRKDTTLVFVDIPGISKANTVNEYTDYVANTWTSFDGVIVVMDVQEGVKTEDQVSLLKFVKEQLPRKPIPVILLCNKVDDPEDEEQEQLVKEARREVETIFDSFGFYTLGTAVETMLASVTKTTSVNHRIHRMQGSHANAESRLWHESGSFAQTFDHMSRIHFSHPNARMQSPAFIAVSAIHAFFHQNASIMTPEAFASFDQDLLEILGRDQFGRRRWNRLSEQEKRDEVFKVVKEGYQDGLQDSNFDKLIKVLGYFFGGGVRQQHIIELQIITSLQSLLTRPFPSEGITSLIRGVHEKRRLFASV